MTTSDETTGFEASGPAPDHRPLTHPVSEQRLHRGRPRLVGGVAAGLADYFDIDPTIVRIGFVVLAFMGGLAVPAYAAGWLLIPDETSDRSIAEELFDRERAGAY